MTTVALINSQWSPPKRKVKIAWAQRRSSTVNPRVNRSTGQYLRWYEMKLRVARLEMSIFRVIRYGKVVATGYFKWKLHFWLLVIFNSSIMSLTLSIEIPSCTHDKCYLVDGLGERERETWSSRERELQHCVFLRNDRPFFLLSAAAPLLRVLRATKSICDQSKHENGLIANPIMTL